MNDVIVKGKKHIERQKRIYVFLSILVLISIIIGIIFVAILANEDKILLTDYLTNFFNQIKTNQKLDYINCLKNSLTSNIFYIVSIWLFGISIIGSIFIIAVLFVKGLIFGFGVGSIVSIYSYKGILGALAYSFPHQLIMLLNLILISFYAFNFSIRLFKHLFLKEEMNVKEVVRKYIKILIITLIVGLFCSLIETFISPLLIKLFTAIL